MKGKRRRFSVYKTLSSALTRASVKNPGVTATLLLETFLEKDGILTAHMVEALNLCKSEGFKEWRDPMIKGGWLIYDHSLARSMGKGSYHQAGKKLLPYLNKEIANSRVVASKDDVDALRAEVSELTERVTALENTVDWVIEQVDPPTSEAKRRFYASHPEKLLLNARLTS